MLNSSESAPFLSTTMTPPSPPISLSLALDDVAGGFGRADAGEPDARADLVRDDRADEVLAAAGRRNRAGRVVGIGAGADDRRIADAAPALVRHAARGGCGREVAIPVARDRADRAEVADVLLDRGRALGLLRVLELLPPALGVEVAAGHERHALLQRELLRALAGEQHVRRALHHHAREVDGIAYVPDACDRARLLRRAVHDCGVELVDARVAEHGAVARIEVRRVFEDADRGDHRVEARASLFEHRIARVERALEIRAVGALVLRGHRGAADHAGAAVNGDRDHRFVSVGGGRGQCDSQAGPEGQQEGGAHPRYYRRTRPRRASAARTGGRGASE